MTLFHRPKQVAFLFIGWVSLALGIIGLLLPVVPQVPFLLLAVFCLTRGSERLHRWFASDPRLENLRLFCERHKPSTPERTRRFLAWMFWGLLFYTGLGTAAFFGFKFFWK